MNSEEQRETMARIRRSLQENKIKVLLVEDDENDAFLVRRLLQIHGIATDWAKDVASALAYVEKEHYRVVFLDMRLDPPGRWEDLLDLIKAKNHTKVIILTGAFTQDSQECKEALQRGAAAVMLKPLTAEQVELIFGCQT